MLSDDDYIEMCDQTLVRLREELKGHKRFANEMLPKSDRYYQLEKWEVKILVLRSIYLKRKMSYAS